MTNTRTNIRTYHYKSAPCKDCKDRAVGCHSTCKKYKEWEAKKDELNKTERYNKVDVSSGWGYIPRKKKNAN